MSTTQIVQAFYREFNARDIDEAMARFAPDCISVVNGRGFTQAEHRSKIDELVGRVPDVRFTALQAFADPTTVMVFGRAAGSTVDGDVFDVSYADWFRVESDRVVAHHTIYDQARFDGE